MKNLCKTLTALACVVCLLAGLAVPALAAVPKRPANNYVLDDAGVLSDSTEDKIVTKNKVLFEKYGAEVVVVAVDFLGGKDIDDYAYELFNDWGIGSSERNNGILLVLAIAEDDYYALSGYGLEDYFDGAKFRELLDDYLEDDFDRGDYDRGVTKFFDKVVDEIEDFYDGYVDEYTEQNNGNYDYDYQPSRFNLWGRVVSLVGRIVLLVFVIIFICSIFGRGRGGRGGPPYGGGGGGGNFWAGMMLGNMMGRSHRRNTWGAPPPPPPRGGFGGGPRPGGGFGGFTGGGRTGGFGGGHSGGGFHGGGGSHGGGAGRR